jgi:membrane-bound lytic murein transglycosylase D
MTQQQVKNYYDLQLNSETSRYVFRIIAIKEIMQHPEKFGLELEEDHLYPPMSDYKTIEVNGPIPSLMNFAVEHGTTYRMLKLYNPWLVGTALTNRSGKKYEVKLPKA